MDRNDYLAMRGRYEPASVRLVIVAESPPTSGLYFYDPSGLISEPLFAAFMKQLGVSPASKDDGLREFQKRGWILVDATYQPVNEMTPSERNAVIVRDYDVLRADLTALLPGRTAPILLMKANVCELLEPRLVADGFNVLNGGRRVPFPVMHHTERFHREFAALASDAKI
jgi:hypothetical protein